MKAFKRFLNSMGCLISSLYSELWDGAANGIEEEDIGKVALNILMLSILTVFLFLTGLIIVKLITAKLHVFVMVGLLAACLYSAKQQFFSTREPEPSHKPTPEDYRAVLETVKPAVAAVAPALGLAPVYGHTDISADPEEWILPWGKVWRMKYKLLKQNANIPVDTALCARVIQAQLKTVLERENPSGLASVRFQWGGRMEPIIQVSSVTDGEAFLYVFTSIASAEYFKQKSEWESRGNLLATGADTDDEDF